MSDEYVVVLDKERDFCRLFRSDSLELPSSDVLWSGNGLRNGYNAMIRLNKERRPTNVYNVCSSESARGTAVYRIVRGEPEGRWKVVSFFFDFASARSAIKELTRKRDEAKAAERERIAAIMRRVGISSRRIPRFTDADLRYVDWLKQTGKFAA